MKKELTVAIKRDLSITRRLTLIYKGPSVQISEGGKLDRTVTPEQAQVIIALMENYCHFFIVK